MKLNTIRTDTAKYQFRENPFSEQTVEGIVREGLDPAKFDPIPVIEVGSVFIVAGDGHSRFEACRRLAESGKLPREWKSGKDWDIPTRIVKKKDALRLAYAANMARDQFKPLEEANIFKARLDDGESVEQIAEASHRSTAHVTRILSLLDLCRDIQVAIDAPEGGINLMTAQVLSSAFKRFNITKDQQRDLWIRALRDARLNPALAKRVMDSIGKRMSDTPSSDTGLMFDLPANAAAVIAEAKREFMALRKARQGLAKLSEARIEGAFTHIPWLAEWIENNGAHAMKQIDKQLNDQALAECGKIGGGR